MRYNICCKFIKQDIVIHLEEEMKLVKHILHRLKNIMNMSLFYSNDSKSYLMSCANASYLSYHHNVLSKT